MTWSNSSLIHIRCRFSGPWQQVRIASFSSSSPRAQLNLRPPCSLHNKVLWTCFQAGDQISKSGFLSGGLRGGWGGGLLSTVDPTPQSFPRAWAIPMSSCLFLLWCSCYELFPLLLWFAQLLFLLLSAVPPPSSDEGPPTPPAPAFWGSATHARPPSPPPRPSLSPACCHRRRWGRRCWRTSSCSSSSLPSSPTSSPQPCLPIVTLTSQRWVWHICCFRSDISRAAKTTHGPNIYMAVTKFHPPYSSSQFYLQSDVSHQRENERWWWAGWGRQLHVRDNNNHHYDFYLY